MNETTRRYLRLVRPPNEAAWAARLAAQAEISAFFGREHLSRPVFLEAAEISSLEADIAAMHALLRSVPERLGGDGWRKLCGLAGLTDVETAAVMASAEAEPFDVARADMVRSGGRFRMLELNLVAVGATDIGDLARATRRIPPVDEFVRAEDLRFTDPMPLVCEQLRRAVAPGGAPRVGVVFAPGESPETRRAFEFLAIVLEDYCFEAVAGELHEVRYDGRHVSVAGLPVDVVYRFFLLEHFTDPRVGEPCRLLDRAEARGHVRIVAPLSADLLGSKRVLALLNQREMSDLLSAAEHELVRRVTPWSHGLAERITDAGGTDVNAVDFCRRHRHRLVLKHGISQGGSGVVIGDQVTPDRWAAAVAAGLARGDVVQSRLEPEPEPFPSSSWPPRADMRAINWGIFLVGGAYGGVVARVPPPGWRGVIGYGADSHLGCCFDEKRGPGR